MDNSKRTKCQRVTRCVGYFRPIDQMNEGKHQEVEDRKLFEISKTFNNTNK